VRGGRGSGMTRRTSGYYKPPEGGRFLERKFSDMACSQPKPNPTELRLPMWADHHRVEDYRNVHCRSYALCIDAAVKEDWEGFSCQKCPMFHNDAAPRAEQYAYDQPADNGRP